MTPVELLTALWETTDVPIPLPQTLTAEQTETMDGLCSAVERKFELALAPGRPGANIVNPAGATKKATAKKAAKKTTGKRK